MKIFKKFLPLIIFVIVLIIGVILFVVKKDFDLFSEQNYLNLSLIIVGGIGSMSSFFIILSYNKHFENDEQNENSFNFSQAIFKQKLEELAEKEEQKQFDNSTENIDVKPEIKHKKIKCTYCKCKFDSTLSRCPNCGAPPESDD